MGDHEAVIAVGLGCRKECPVDEIVALVREALVRLPPGSVAAGLFSIADKAGEPGLVEAAAALGLPLALLEASELRSVAGSAATRSPRIEAMHGVPSVAETAALAGAGPGAVLLLRRIATRRATCAIAGPPPQDEV